MFYSYLEFLTVDKVQTPSDCAIHHRSTLEIPINNFYWSGRSKSGDSSVNKVTGYGMDALSSIPGIAEGFLFTTKNTGTLTTTAKIGVKQSFILI
jgi:hypothetical protein